MYFDVEVWCDGVLVLFLEWVFFGDVDVVVEECFFFVVKYDVFVFVGWVLLCDFIGFVKLWVGFVWFGFIDEVDFGSLDCYVIGCVWVVSYEGDVVFVGDVVVGIWYFCYLLLYIFVKMENVVLY